MKKIIFILLAIAFLPPRILGQVVRSNPPVTPRAETTLAKTVVRITSTVEGIDQPINGTGFIVVVPVQGLPGSHFIAYLVTNRHIAEAITTDGAGTPIKHRVLKMQAIVNLKTSVNGTRVHVVPLPPESTETWHFPEDRSIDLAVITFPLDDSYDIAHISPGLFFTEDLWDKYRIVPGNKVMTCGYFLRYAGAHQFQPIVREGSLAMVPDDVLEVPIGGKGKGIFGRSSYYSG